jgi:hypothetical protein
MDGGRYVETIKEETYNGTLTKSICDFVRFSLLKRFYVFINSNLLQIQTKILKTDVPIDYIIQAAKTHFFHVIIKQFTIDIDHIIKVRNIVRKQIKVRDVDIPTKCGEVATELTVKSSNSEMKIFIECFDLSRTSIERIYI